MSRDQLQRKSKSVKTQHKQQQSLSSRLQKLRRQIYHPYRSILKIQNQQKFLQPTNSSLSIKPSKKTSFLSSSKASIYGKAVKLPSLTKNKSDSVVREMDSAMAISALIPDPYVNGKIKSQRQEIYKNMSDLCNQYKFLKTIQKYELQFLQNCNQKRYNSAQQIISIMLNYSIDLNIIDYLCFSLRVLGDFNFQCSNNDKAFFYYNQCRKCSHYIGQYQFMIESLMKMAQCAVKGNFNAQAVRFLKKALQYIWYYQIFNLQLRVYDEIGRVYYIMGDAQNAKIFHHKYFTGSVEPKESSIRLLSIQSLQLEGLSRMKIIRNISPIFLWMINIPFKNCSTLQQFNKNQEGEQKISISPRKNYDKDMKYFQQFKSLKQAISDVFSSDLFKNQLGQMHIDKIDWAAPMRNKKYLFYDIQRNNHLKAQGIPFQNYFAKQKTRKIKITIRSKFKTENTDQILSGKDLQTWLQSITSQTIKKHKNNTRDLGNRVCVRGLNQPCEPKTTKFRILYNQYFDFTQSHSYKKATIKQEQNDQQE